MGDTKSTIATRLAAAFGNDGSNWTATSLEIIGSNQYVHVGDTMQETLEAFGESCGTATFVFGDGSSITIADDRTWQIDAPG